MGARLSSIFMTGFYCTLMAINSLVFMPGSAFPANSLDYQSTPPFVTAGVPPLVMLVMGRNHKLYYEAYNDASDLNGDGVLDVGYKPSIDYYGYFDSYKYYEYSAASSRFNPKGETEDKKAPSGNYWSGDFLNYLTMTRMDCLRKVLYGGFRSTDSATETVLQRVYVPQDAHSWGKEYYSIAHDGYDIQDYTPLYLPKGGSRHLFASTTLNGTNDPILRVLENSIYRIWEWVAIEGPVAGGRALDGGSGPDIKLNNTSGAAVDATDGGSAGSMDDGYAGGAAAPAVIKTDDFNDGILDADWNWFDNDGSGSTSHSETGGRLVIDAAGADVWSTSDRYAAVYLDNINGNFDFKLKITQQERQNGWGKTGIMVRNDITDPGSSPGYCMMCVTPDNGFSFQWDSDANGYLNQSAKKSSVSMPAWVRLTKEGNQFKGYYSEDGTVWVEVGTATLASATATQDVGVFVTAHDSDKSECKFDEMSLTALGADEPVPALAFDDDAGTRWSYPDEPSTLDPAWIEFAFTTPIEIRSYTINADSDAPEDWTLEGSVDQTNWNVVDTVSNAGLTAGSKASFDCDNSGIYKYYRLVITESSLPATDGVSIAEIELMESTEPLPAYATLTDYDVRVKVCDAAIGLEPNSKEYPSGVAKPIGLLQRHGESDRMYFGLTTGSYIKNTSGGVLRKNVGSIKDEINSDTGEFLYQDDASVDGIVKTIDRFKIVDFNGSSYSSNCGWIATRPVNEGECRMWGNPVAEMMYESLRYFSGAATPTSDFTYGNDSGYDDNELGLPKPDWLDPYSEGEDSNGNGTLDAGEDLNGNGILDGFDYCAKPFMLVLSDINPTFDSNQLPGSAFGTVSSSLGTMNVETLANTISDEEGDITTHFIGQSSSYDGACSPKLINGFGDIRGLCPEEPTKQGSYYSAAVAYYGNKEDINPGTEQSQSVSSYCVGLASPLPTIEIQVGESVITLVPFGKSVGGYSISSTEGAFQPTNTIVDFFVEAILPTYGKFRINYEDVEQGADHDMDAIVEYEYQVVDAADNPVMNPADGEKVIITLNSTYAAGSIIQHMGYVISGSTKDGSYLEVRDKDTGASSDPDYFLDTPPGIDPGGDWDDDTALPLTSTRTFEPGSTEAATLLNTPLWYAAKWGGFEDYNGNGLPDLENEWDKDGDGEPDTYFYVQNPLRLEEQLNKSFADILRRTASGTAASVISQTRSGEGAVYQAVFYPEFKGSLGNTVSWTGDVHALFVDSMGNMREDTDGDMTLDVNPVPDPAATDRIIEFDGTVIYKYIDRDGDGVINDTDTPEFTGTVADIKYLWSSSSWLNEMTDAETESQRIYGSTARNRYIFTFADENENMVVDSGETVEFVCNALPAVNSLTDETMLYPYLNLFPTFEDEPSMVYNGTAVSLDTFRQNLHVPGDAATDPFEDFLLNQTRRVINYVRGVDQPEFVSATTPSYTIPAFRSRQVDYDDDGLFETWRLGDIVYSTPSVVGRPAEAYHLLYKDKSYGVFADAFKNRRQMVYTGANDGMFHAFNAGFYDADAKRFVKQVDGETEYDLGAELWAYVPYNLLPHLYWLTESAYPHVYYCDLKPKIFDAKVLPNGKHYTDSDGQPNWGTLLVAGMRFGGGAITADMDKTDGNTPQADDRKMASAFFIIDITDPESPPEILAEIRFEGLGYTTCYPAAVPMKDKKSGAITANEWYLVFGSGPAAADGTPGNNDGTSLSKATSFQTAKLYVVDLKELVLNKTLKTLDSTGVFTAAPSSNPSLKDYYQELDADSFVSDPISVDYDLDYNVDVVYFGTISGDNTGGWGGKMRRLVTDNETSPVEWTGDSTLFNLDAVHSGQPVMAPAAVGHDDLGRRWVYWGTGRFFVREDAPNSDVQSYYAVKEPFTDNNTNGKWDPETDVYAGDTMTWNEVTSNLIDVTDAKVYADKTVENVNDVHGTAVSTWDDLIAAVDDMDCNGWFMDFEIPRERSLGQATLLGEILTFTTYIPSSDNCSFEGESRLYAPYYKTGTAYYESVFKSNVDKVVSQFTFSASTVEPDEGSPAYIDLPDLGDPTEVDSYTITVGGHAAEGPESWVLQAYDDDADEWVTVEIVTGDDLISGSLTGFSFSDTDSYDDYQVITTENGEITTSSISESALSSYSMSGSPKDVIESWSLQAFDAVSGQWVDLSTVSGADLTPGESQTFEVDEGAPEGEYTEFRLAVTGTSSEEEGFGEARIELIKKDEDDREIKRDESLGDGLAVTPNMHVGEEEGSTALIQTSTGAIKKVGELTKPNKSRVTSWKSLQ